MAQPHLLHAYLLSLFILVTCLTPGTSVRWGLKTSSLPSSSSSSSLPSSSPNETLASSLCTDPSCIITASSDYGEIVQDLPFGVLNPSSISDIAHLVKSSYNSSSPFTIAARGNGHSVRGQAMAKDGVVVEMTSLNSSRGGGVDGNVGIRVSWDVSLGFYADVGGEQLWIDVLRTTLDHGLAPVSWTDYLYLTVGGTLSNAGISGQTFRHGPQISNVHELDVLTGKGELVSCSKSMNSDLFYAVLGGLGQFGIITRARIVLDKAPNRVKWVRMIYEDFSNFTNDQEHLISIPGLDYVEGFLITKNSPANNFFLPSDGSTINSLASENGILYCLEAVKYYDDHNITTIDEELEMIFTALSFKSGFIFKKDTSFFEFLNRVRNEELELEAIGQWNVAHPWLNLFVPRSRIMDFNQGVFVEVIQKQSKSSG
ncbi:CO dehydrogenase flavoprotein-like, FAD-binding, subdomain 2, partial [Cynara cardunculus var. scolymus]